MREYYCYVYYDEHWQPYYVGKGFGRRRFKQHKIKVPTSDYIQTFYFETEWLAYECEVQLINFWKRQSDGGCLLNKALGGPGSTGVIHTPETRARMSASHIGLRHLPKVEERRIAKCRAASSKPVSLVNLKTNEVLSFPSRSAACKALGWCKSNLVRLLSREYKQMNGWKLNG